jgi:cysteine desulfurase
MDNHATTPVDPRVLEAMLPLLTQMFGNPASRQHRYGWEAAEAVEAAREQVARLINADSKEIIFTSGATESDNLAIKGVARASRDRGNHIVTLPTEHKAVLDTCRRLEQEGFKISFVPVRADGLVDIDDLKAAFSDKTILVSIMAAHNEIGVLQPLGEIGRLCRERAILFHTDAAQAAGKIPMDVRAMHIDLLSISAHKMYGPKGVGALYVRRQERGVRLAPLLDGGGHEGGMRPGTLNVPGIVGLGKASEICREVLPEESRHLRALRDRLQEGILARLEEVYVNGTLEQRLPNNLNLSFASVDRASLLTALNDVALSSGSACASAIPAPSYVLKALGAREDLAHSSIRFGLGRFSTQEEVDYVIDRVVETTNLLRELTAPGEVAKETGEDGKVRSSR